VLSRVRSQRLVLRPPGQQAQVLLGIPQVQLSHAVQSDLQSSKERFTHALRQYDLTLLSHILLIT
jgi:hypothetical protein